LSAPRFSFFAGKGGVGKTTCAAAFASSRQGQTLVVSTDPAHSLGDALGLELGRTPRRVAGRLFACELDADRALSRWFGERKRAFRILASRGTYLDDDDIDELLESSLPGVDELVGLIELLRLSQGGWDEVVVDTAPTGHTLRLLAMPRTLEKLARVLDDLSRKHRYLSESLGGRGYVPDATDRVVTGIESQASELSELLCDRDRCGFHVVLLAEDLSIEEATDAVAGIRAVGGHVVEVIVNAVRRRPPGRCAFCEGKRAAQRAAFARIRDAFAGLRVRLVGEADTEPVGLSALRKLSRSRVDAPRGRARRAGAPPDNSADWLPLLVPDGVRLVLLGGKGGVGKTTCAAVCALELAARGRRALLLSTDPAHSLGDAFATAIGDAGCEVAPRLRAREVDADRAFAAERDKYRKSVEELFDALRGSTALEASFDRQVVRNLIDLSPPGIDELFGLFAVIDALPSFDVVVVDTAPTGHALRLLALPEKALGWIHAILEILLKYRRVIGLGDLARTLTGTARSLRELRELFSDSAACRFVPVTRAARLPVLETRRLLRSLRRLRIKAGPLLVNAATPEGCARCRRASRREAALRKALRAPTDGMLIAPALPVPPRGAEALVSFGRGWARP
jgi:arsenite-transporting ATPase